MSAHRHIVRPRKTLLLLLRQMSPPRQGRRERLFAVCIDPDMENGRKVTPDQLGGEMAGKGWMVVTGGGEGIMEAAHVGAGQGLAKGINILLTFEPSANRIIASDPKLIHVKYFFTRKLLFVKESSGVALFPGGFGTLDEAFEVLTLLQPGEGTLFPLSRPLPQNALARIRRDFSDILASGSFRLGASLPDEENEPLLAGLPRLIFRFNRKHFRGLRMLVALLNPE